MCLLKILVFAVKPRVHKQPIIALYFEFENVLKFYNLEAWAMFYNLLNVNKDFLSSS